MRVSLPPHAVLPTLLYFTEFLESISKGSCTWWGLPFPTFNTSGFAAHYYKAHTDGLLSSLVMVLFTFFAFICFLFPSTLTFTLPVSDDSLVVPVGSSLFTVRTLLGTASGTPDEGAYRFPVKYASANRWAPSTVAQTWALPCVFLQVFMLKAQWA